MWTLRVNPKTLGLGFRGLQAHELVIVHEVFIGVDFRIHLDPHSTHNHGQKPRNLAGEGLYRV